MTEADLFTYTAQQSRASSGPLAHRIRPQTFDDVVGQQHLVAPHAPLRQLVELGHFGSSILWGPPGTGKTSIAHLIAESLGGHFIHLSATTAGTKEIREAAAIGEAQLAHHGRRTVVLLDEVHRCNKTQQDVLLPPVEDGTFILIGATTENPYYNLNAALLSRCLLYGLQPLSEQETAMALRRGLEALGARAELAVLQQIYRWAGGDVRQALNLLELVAAAASRRPGACVVTIADLDGSGAMRTHHMDTSDHYGLARALIAAIYSSDQDATAYWLARCLKSGMDPRFVARRLMILASEEIGTANNHCLPLAVAAAQATEMVGLPEAGLILCHAAIALASSPKSLVAAKAWWEMTTLVQQQPDYPVPAHLAVTRSPNTDGSARSFDGAFLAHMHSDHPQSCLPADLDLRSLRASPHAADGAPPGA